MKRKRFSIEQIVAVLKQAELCCNRLCLMRPLAH